MGQFSEQEKLIQRARELANSGQYSGWASIEGSMRGGRELIGDPNPLDDADLRRELDARCIIQMRDREIGSDGLIVLLSSCPKAPANNYWSF
jgi:hypothetical protein